MTLPDQADPPPSPKSLMRFPNPSTGFGRVNSLVLFAIGFAVIVLSIGLSCGGTQQKEFRIGLNAAITGALPVFGESSINAANLAVDQINEAGGLEVAGQKYKVVLVIEDNEDKAEVASSKTLKLVNEGRVVAIVGPAASRNAIPAAIAAEQAQILMISPSSTNAETTLGKKWVFRAAFIDPDQGRALARFVSEQLGAKSAAVLFDAASAYNRDLAEIFRLSFQERGGEVVAFESYTTDVPDVTQQLSRIKESGPEVLFLPNYYQEVPEQVRQARDAGIDAQLIGGDSWGSILERDREGLNGAYFTTLFAPGPIDPVAQRFITDYREAFGQEPDEVAALTFDSIGLLFQAARIKGKVDSAAVRDGLASIRNYQGVTGPYWYDGVTGDPIRRVNLMKIENGEYVFHSRVTP